MRALRERRFRSRSPRSLAPVHHNRFSPTEPSSELDLDRSAALSKIYLRETLVRREAFGG